MEKGRRNSTLCCWKPPALSMIKLCERLTNNELISMVRSSVTSRGAEVTAYVFRNFLENEHPESVLLQTNPENLILKMDFKNAFNSLKRDNSFRKRRQIYNYTLSATSETSHLFFGEKVIQPQEGCQQEDTESPALFSDTIQDLVNQMVSHYNVWYLDDRNLSDDYRTVLEILK